MSEPTVEELIARLNNGNLTSRGAQGASVTASSSLSPPASVKESTAEKSLDEALKRVHELAEAAVRAPVKAAAQPKEERSTFHPVEPRSYIEAQITESEVESLVLKYLLSRGDASGRSISDQVKLPMALVEPLLATMKRDQLLGHRGAAAMNDYVFQLTDVGRERARRMATHCTYFGSAPVSLADYVASVVAQSLDQQHPTEENLKQAFADLLIDPSMLRRLGPAINSGRGLFLFGSAGNGKTSIAERITRCFGEYIWIPRALGVDGEIIRLFDPSNHQEAPLPPGAGLLDEGHIDKRWVRIRRPTIIVGGELTMDSLEVTLNTSTGISEAPMQLKSNCGTLVIDDFGRQRMTTDELLNRWIVPLEKRHDYLNLANGKKIQVPFDQLIVFSTNLEPKDLVDEAFLRRIPYKIEAANPSEDAFRELFRLMAPKVGCEYDEDSVQYLIEKYYKGVGRPMRCCQPRDLLLQIRNHCLYQNVPSKMSRENFDFAVENYFAVM